MVFAIHIIAPLISESVLGNIPVNGNSPAPFLKSASVIGLNILKLQPTQLLEAVVSS